MRLFWNILLALFWAALWGKMSLPYLSAGLVLGYLVLMALERSELIENNFYGRRVWRMMSFALFFLKELLVANLVVAIEVLRPQPRHCPAVIKVPLTLTSDTQITLLANVITLTPGTLTLDVSADRKFIFVHTMFFDPAQRDVFVDGIQQGFEKRIKELFAT